jgi:hypothetical protein
MDRGLRSERMSGAQANPRYFLPSWREESGVFVPVLKCFGLQTANLGFEDLAGLDELAHDRVPGNQTK